MFNYKKNIFIFGLILVLITGLVGCGENTTDSADETGEIKIAVVGPMTGDSAQYGQAFKNGTEIMAKKVNENGGIDGKQLKLEFFDDKDDSKEAVNVAQRIVSDEDIVGVIGHFLSTTSLAAAPVYQRGEIIELSPTTSHPEFTDQGTFIFRNNIDTRGFEAPILADFAMDDLEKKDVAVIYVNDDWGITCKDGFTERIEELGGNITAVESFVGGQTNDFTPTLTKIKETGAEVLLVAAMYSEAAMIANQLKQIDYDVQLLGHIPLNNEEFLKLAEDAADGMFITNTFYPEDPSENVQEFVKEFEAEYDVKPNMFEAYAYDSLGMIVEALKRSGPDRVKLRDELAKTKDYPGVTGNITFDEDRNASRDMLIMQIKDNKYNFYKKIPAEQ